MESIAKGVGSLLTDSKYCDVEIRCGGQTFLKHRAIVCARCDVLAEECENSVKVSDSHKLIIGIGINLFIEDWQEGHRAFVV